MQCMRVVLTTTTLKTMNTTTQRIMTRLPAPSVLMEPPSSLSSEALHILQALETSGFEDTPTEKSDAINSLIDQLPLSNFMTEVEPVDDFLHTRVGPRDHEVRPITES